MTTDHKVGGSTPSGRGPVYIENLVATYSYGAKRI